MTRVDDAGSVPAGERFVQTRFGAEDAPVTLRVFNRYSCGFCAEFASTIYSLLVRYPQHLDVEVLNLPVRDAGSHWTFALGAECAAQQGAFERYHRAAFSDPRVAYYSAGWRSMIERVDIPDPADFERCVEREEQAHEVMAHREVATKLGLRGTPGWEIGAVRGQGVPAFPLIDSLVADRIRSFSAR